MENKMVNPLLSICIPTYNNDKLLNEAIKSIVEQVHENIKGNVEICISDNASSDNTSNVVNKWKLESPINIHYQVNSKNFGFDYNLLKVVEMANGKFCWLLGSDDYIEKDSLRQALILINENKEVGLFILSRKSYDFKMKKEVLSSDPLKKKFNQNTKFSNVFDTVSNVASTLSCFSVLLFKKEKWNLIKGNDEFIGSIYMHIYKMLSMVKSGMVVMYVTKNFVKSRTGNDYYLQQLKYVGRLKKDIVGYSKISETVFGKDSKEYKAIMNQFIGDHLRMYTIAGIKINGHKKEVKELFKLYFEKLKKVPRFWIHIFPFMLVPALAYKLASKTIYQNKYNKFKNNLEDS